VSDYEHCLHTEHTGQKRLVRPVEEPSNNADNEDNFERSKNITELVSSDSVVAVKAEDDDIEYYMKTKRKQRKQKEINKNKTK
jgi:hypothetical protein